MEITLDRDRVKHASVFEIGDDPVPHQDLDFSKMIQPWWDMFPYEVALKVQDLYAQLEKAVQEEEQKEAQRKLRLASERAEMAKQGFKILWTAIAIIGGLFLGLLFLQKRKGKRV